MNSFQVLVDVPVTVTLKVTNDNSHWISTPENETIYLAVSVDQGVCMPYIKGIYTTEMGATRAFRETDDGIQFWSENHCWKFFDKETQQLWFSYKAEQALLED